MLDHYTDTKIAVLLKNTNINKTEAWKIRSGNCCWIINFSNKHCHDIQTALVERTMLNQNRTNSATQTLNENEVYQKIIDRFWPSRHAVLENHIYIL